jgi:hypothetical protein
MLTARSQRNLQMCLPRLTCCTCFDKPVLSKVEGLSTNGFSLNQASRDWHTSIVTLNAVKGLALRFFATLRMTRLEGRVLKCTNVLYFGLEC